MSELGLYIGPPITVIGQASRTIVPRWISRADLLPGVNTVRCASLLDYCLKRRPESICLRRTYALGDILMLLPVIRAFRKHLHAAVGFSGRITVVIATNYVQDLMPLRPLLAHEGIGFAEDRGLIDYHAHVHMDLNHVLSPDHNPANWQSRHHRLDLYARALGFASGNFLKDRPNKGR